MKRHLKILVLAALLFSLKGTAWGDFYVIPTAPSFVGTRITSLPYPITKSGFYYLAANLSSTGNGITVGADDVTIDLAGFTLTGSGGQEVYGVLIAGQQNVEVRNGTVRNFWFGIGSNSLSTRLINVRAEFNLDTGIACYGGGTLVNGGGTLVMGCYSGNNNVGFDFAGSANVLNNVAHNNGGIGFWMFNDPFQLLDRNVSSQNGTDWDSLLGCTIGLNTPPPASIAATAADVQKAPLVKRTGLKLSK